MFTETVNIWLQQFSAPWLDKLFLAVTSLGSEYTYLLLLTFVYWCINRRAGRTLLVGFMLSAWLSSVLKDAMGMSRPSPDLVRVLVQEWSSGFPSGHAQNAALVWGYIAMRWPKRWVITLSAVLIFLISLSRLYLGAHFLYQVLGGAALGLACAAIMYIWERRGKLPAQPLAWRTLLAVCALYLLAIPVQSDDGFRIAGVLMGFLLTDAIPRRTTNDAATLHLHASLQHDISWAVRLARALVGWLILGVGYVVIKLYAAPGLPTLLACAAMAVWITAGAPAVFRRLKLGTWERQIAEPPQGQYPIPAEVPVPGVVSLTPATMPVFAAGMFLLLAVGLTLPTMDIAGMLSTGIPPATEATTVSSALPALHTESSFLVLAHKGGEGLAPANTIAAFGNGLQIGADVLECDVRRTLDGQLVVIHDERVDRVTNGTGAVSSLSLQEIRNLDAGYWFTPGDGTYPYRGKDIHIPTLESVLKAYPTAKFNIDMKDHSPDMPHALLAVLDAAGARDRVIVASFDGPTIRRFRQLAPDVPTSLAQDEMLRFVIMARLGLGMFYKTPARYMQIPARQGPVQLAVPATFKLAHRLGIDVHIWTINDRGTMQQLIAEGADGIVTDYPDRLVALLAK